MGEPHIHSDLDLDAPMTQGTALLLLRKMESIEELLQKQVSDKPATVSVKEFANLTGMGESTVTLYINKLKIRAEKLGGLTSPWRIPYEEVERINNLAG